MDTPTPTVEIEDRTFLVQSSSVPMVIYPLPVDEEARITGIDPVHGVLKQVVGANYYGPVTEILAEDLGRTKHALDLGCGTPLWISDMATEFPHVKFTGVDIYLNDHGELPANVELKVANANGRLPFDDEFFDVVHLRHVQLITIDFPALLREAARLLRPGGLLLVGEWGAYSVLDDDSGLTMEQAVPKYFKFIVGFTQHCVRLGIPVVAELLPNIVRDTGKFTNVSDVLFLIPVGEKHPDKDSKELGIIMMDVMFEVAAGVRHMFTNPEVGWSDDDFDELVGQMEHEFRTAPAMLIQYVMLHATKI